MKTKPFSKEIFIKAIINSFIKLNPASLFHNPVIFITEIGAILTTVEAIIPSNYHIFSLHIAIWLWFTVLFANFAEGIALARNKAQADALKKSEEQLMANRILADGSLETVSAKLLKKGDKVRVLAEQFIPADGEIIKGEANIDESAVTGESKSVIKIAGTDNSSVIAGTKVLSDEIEVLVSSNPGESFLDKMIALVEGARRQKTPNELALTIIISGLALIFLFVVITMRFFSIFFHFHISIAMLIAFLICLIPTTIAGLLNAIGIAGINRLMRHNVIALNGQAVEVAGDIDTILIDKTGTITQGTRRATDLIGTGSITELELMEAAYLCSKNDQTFEGRSIIELIKTKYPEIEKKYQNEQIEFIHFKASLRMSSAIYKNDTYYKGAIDAIEKQTHMSMPFDLFRKAQTFAREGGTPIIIAKNSTILGLITLKDIIKEGLAEQFNRFKKLGIKTIMLTGDNPITAAAIAKEAQVDSFIAEFSPEQKLNHLLKMQKEGHIVAMTGDGVNDAPALAHANVGVAMNSGTQAAKEAGNMIDLDSNPIKLFKIIEIGKQMLITRGSLTTFSIANDIAKYFAIIPAMLSPYIPAINCLNIMHLNTPQSAALSAVIFNALIIIMLIPLAFKGVKLIAAKAIHILNRNILIYGLGGIILPFIGIKVIDLILNALGAVK